MKNGDILIICIVIIISIVSFSVLFLSNQSVNQKNAIIKIGEDEKSVSFDNSTAATYEFEFGQEVGYIEFKNGRLRMVKMNKEVCPNQICSLTGWIEKKFETIVCLPNKITVSINYIQSNEEKIDDIAY